MLDGPAWEIDAVHEEFRASVRAFADRHVRPVAEDSEQAGRPPAALLRAMGTAGLLGLAAGEEDGGGAGDSLAIAILAEELTRASGGIAITALVSAYMAMPHITRFGTAAQRARYLPGLIAGETIAAIAVTEPGAGSDVAGIRCRAVEVAGGFRIDGTKMFITNAGIADVIIVAARTSPERHRGITTFLVDRGTPGLAVGAPLRKLGWHASDTREVILHDCIVPPDAVLGTVGRGFEQIMTAFQLERLALAGMSLGHAAECVELASRHAADREVFGCRLIDLQATRHRLAVLAVELAASRLLTYAAAARLDSGHPAASRSVAMAKYHAAVSANRIVDECLQLFGGSGFLEENVIARHFRDARVLRIGGGTDEIQLEILGRGQSG